MIVYANDLLQQALDSMHEGAARDRIEQYLRSVSSDFIENIIMQEVAHFFTEGEHPSVLSSRPPQYLEQFITSLQHEINQLYWFIDPGLSTEALRSRPFVTFNRSPLPSTSSGLRTGSNVAATSLRKVPLENYIDFEEVTSKPRERPVYTRYDVVGPKGKKRVKRVLKMSTLKKMTTPLTHPLTKQSIGRSNVFRLKLDEARSPPSKRQRR